MSYLACNPVKHQYEMTISRADGPCQAVRETRNPRLIMPGIYYCHSGGGLNPVFFVSSWILASCALRGIRGDDGCRRRSGRLTGSFCPGNGNSLFLAMKDCYAPCSGKYKSNRGCGVARDSRGDPADEQAGFPRRVIIGSVSARSVPGSWCSGKCPRRRSPSWAREIQRADSCRLNWRPRAG